MLGKCHESSLRLTELNLKRKEERKLMLGVEGPYKYTNCDGTCFASLIKRNAKLAPRVRVFIWAFDT